MSKLFLNISEELLESGYSIEFQATGNSMHPTIKDGEMITVQPLRISDIKAGDVVLYRNQTGVIAHRVVRVEQRDHIQLILRGDASETFDAPVDAHQILGKVISTTRADKKIALNKRGLKLVHVLRAKLSQIVHRVSVLFV